MVFHRFDHTPTKNPALPHFFRNRYVLLKEDYSKNLTVVHQDLKEYFP